MYLPKVLEENFAQQQEIEIVIREKLDQLLIKKVILEEI